MTEAQAIAKAWRTIADAYYTPRSERTKAQKRIAYYGCCCAVGVVCGSRCEFGTDGSIPIRNRGLYDSMIRDVRRDVVAGYFFCSYEPSNDILRADYCILQAVIVETGGV